MIAELFADLGTALVVLGRHEEATNHLERALVLASAHELPQELSRALAGKAWLLADRNRVVEAVGLMSIAVNITHDQRLAASELNSRINLGDIRFNSDLPGAVEEFETALVLARRLGDVDGAALCLLNLAIMHLYSGRWDDAEASGHEGVTAAPSRHREAYTRWPLVVLYSARGRSEEAAHQLAALEALADSDDVQDLAALYVGRAAVALAVQELPMAAAAAAEAVRVSGGMRTEGFRSAWPLALEAALAADLLDEASRLLAIVGDAPKGHVPPYLRAQHARYRALIAAANNLHDTVQTDLRSAIDILTDLDYPYWRARAEADLATWLTTHNRPDEAQPLLTSAVDTFTRLKAQPDLDRTRPLALVTARG